MKQTKLKVGDKVRIKRDLKVGENYAGMTFVEDMKRMRGKISTITSVYCCGSRFSIKDNPWSWTPEMLETDDKLIFRENATILFKGGEKYVSKCVNGDSYDREKGLLMCIAKSAGYTYKDIQEMLAQAELQTPKGLKLGDRVRVVGGELAGKEGSVIAFWDNDVGVDFDNWTKGHACNGIGRYGHCWWVIPEYLSVIKR